MRAPFSYQMNDGATVSETMDQAATDIVASPPTKKRCLNKTEGWEILEADEWVEEILTPTIKVIAIHLSVRIHAGYDLMLTT
jgi:hypothetical protein